MKSRHVGLKHFFTNVSDVP